MQAHNKAHRTHLSRNPIQPDLPARLRCSTPKLTSVRPKLASTYRARLSCREPPANSKRASRPRGCAAQAALASSSLAEDGVLRCSCRPAGPHCRSSRRGTRARDLSYPSSLRVTQGCHPCPSRALMQFPLPHPKEFLVLQLSPNLRGPAYTGFRRAGAGKNCARSCAQQSLHARGILTKLSYNSAVLYSASGTGKAACMPAEARPHYIYAPGILALVFGCAVGKLILGVS